MAAGLQSVAACIENDPPAPEELTNAVGLVADDLDDVVRERPDAIGARTVFCGDMAQVLIDVEAGRVTPGAVELSRADVEDLFRALVTESRAERAHNPGLPSEHIDNVVAASCALVGVMRRLRLDTIAIDPLRSVRS
jgi:exopolyphosphatase/pppGpp-phosphohydrolase